MNKSMIRFLVFTAVLAAAYAVITIVLAPISYGMVQFRLSEILVLLAFIDRKTIPGLALGCILANLYSQLGMVDVIFGTLATYISVLMMYQTKNMWVASLWPSIVNGVIIGILLHIMLDLPLILSILSVAAGEFVVVTVIGVPLMKNVLLKNETLMNALHLSYDKDNE